MYRLMLDYLEGFVIVLDSDVSATYESVNFLQSEAYG